MIKISQDVKGGMDYALLKRHYDNIDYVQLSFAGPFAGVEQSYVIGTMAYVADPTMVAINPVGGWVLYTPTAPLPLAYQFATPPLTQGPAFEAKDILFYASVASVVRFGTPARVQVALPATTFMRFHTRCFVIYATQAGGTLDIWPEG